MGRTNILHAGKEALLYPRKFHGQILHQSLHHLPLESILIGTQGTRGGDEADGFGELLYLRFRTLEKWANDDVASIITSESRGHRLYLTRKKQVQQQGVDEIVLVMSKGNLRATQPFRSVVEDTPT